MYGPDKEKLPVLKIKTTLITFLLVLLMADSLSAGDSSVLPDEFKPEKILSFTENLIASGEYYRAYVELDRLNSYYPGYLSPLTYNVTKSFMLFKSARYDDILRGEALHREDEETCITDIFKIDSLLKTYNTDGAAGLLSGANCGSDSVNQYYNKRKDYISILNRFNNPDEKDIDNFYDYKDSASYADYLHGMKKSPLTGAAAGLIPGMGYIYAGEPGTGIVALIVIAAGSAITYGAYKSGVEPLAVLSGTATFFMYTGSIAGGYMQTVKYNRRLSDSLVLRLEKDFMLDKDIDEIYVNFGIKSNVR